jgi:hypothetical protein
MPPEIQITLPSTLEQRLALGDAITATDAYVVPGHVASVTAAAEALFSLGDSNRAERTQSRGYRQAGRRNGRDGRGDRSTDGRERLVLEMRRRRRGLAGHLARTRVRWSFNTHTHTLRVWRSTMALGKVEARVLPLPGR